MGQRTEERALLRSLSFESAAHDFAEDRNRGVGDAVVRVQTLFSAIDEARASQQPEMLRDVGLVQPVSSTRSETVRSPSQQNVQNAEASGLGENAKPVGDELEDLRRKLFGHNMDRAVAALYEHIVI